MQFFHKRHNAVMNCHQAYDMTVSAWFDITPDGETYFTKHIWQVLPFATPRPPSKSANSSASSFSGAAEIEDLDTASVIASTSVSKDFVTKEGWTQAIKNYIGKPWKLTPRADPPCLSRRSKVNTEV